MIESGLLLVFFWVSSLSILIFDIRRMGYLVTINWKWINRHEKHIIYSILFVYILFVSCTSEQETETYIPIDEIIPLDTHLIPNKDTKIVSTTLNFKDIDAIDYLLVRKSVGDSYSAKISQSELTSDYIFNYTIQKQIHRIFG